MNILFLCTYPITEPKHGGQIRVRHLISEYQNKGHVVEIIGVLGSGSYPAEAGFLPFPGNDVLETVYDKPFLMEDFAIGELFARDDFYYTQLVALIKQKPDVIHIEQPWLFRFIKRVVADNKWDTALIYGSQNIEYELKEKILRNYISAQLAKNAADLIKQVELEAISSADGIIAVSAEERKTLELLAKKPVLLAPNGVAAWTVGSDDYALSVSISRGQQYALYCASGHPPNITGFFNIFGGGFGSLKPSQKLIVAGGAGGAIANDPRVHQSAKLSEKIVLAGMVAQDLLESLLNHASCIVLPITEGGGTNLKTAEALWSGKYVLATSVAMRGFEQFIGAQGVFVEDSSVQFKRRLREIMEMPPLLLSEEDVNQRSAVLWGSCLSELDNYTKKIVENKVP